MRLKEVLSYWEPRRFWYNLALIALAGVVVLRTWPHFRPAFIPSSIPRLIILGAIANLCYSSVYVIEALAQSTGFGTTRRRWRGGLWSVGTLLALALEYYWIVDEIYPSVH